MEIQTAVHKIYQQLSVTLERALQANKHHIGNNSLIKSLSWQFMRSRDLFSLVLSKSFTSLTRVKMRPTFRTGWTCYSDLKTQRAVSLSLPGAFNSFSCFLSILEAQQRLLLVTVFALSVRYQPVDVSLAISSGLLNVLSQLCGTETMLGQPLQLLQKPGVSQLSTALKVASTRLLQILAISTGYELKEEDETSVSMIQYKQNMTSTAVSFLGFAGRMQTS